MVSVQKLPWWPNTVRKIAVHCRGFWFPWLPITVHQLLCNTVMAVYRGKPHRDEKSLPRKALKICTPFLGYRLFFLFFSFISLIADGPHHYHPACGHKGSSHLSPVHAVQFFYRDASSALLQLVNQWLKTKAAILFGFLLQTSKLCPDRGCVLPSHLFWTSDLWTHQPGSHRRKVTQDFSTSLLRCLPYFFS